MQFFTTVIAKKVKGRHKHYDPKSDLQAIRRVKINALNEDR